MNNRLTLFPAPVAPGSPVVVNVPGSKSYTIRALLLAAMTPGPVTLRNPLVSDDTLAMLACLDTLGIRTQRHDDRIEVIGHIGDVQEGDFTLNADLSAASIRFLLALSAVLPGVQTLHGREGLNKRPVRDLVDSLRALGAAIDYLERDGFPPVRVSSSALRGSVASVSGAISSQYLSALMMLAPAANGLRLEVLGDLVSRPYLEMTLSIMRSFGVQVATPDKRTFVVAPGQSYRTSSYVIEGDASAACYPIATAALTATTVELRNLPADSVQADMRVLDILERMGNRVERYPDRILFKGVGVQPAQIDMCDCPDQAQTLAVLLTFANGTSRLDGLRSLRVKETDRLSAMARELAKMGVRVEEEAEALVLHGGHPQPAPIETYGDHRMAMAFAVAGARLPGLEILDPKVVGKTYPTFWEECPAWGIGIGSDLKKKEATIPSKIVLIGFMGAGKSHLATLLSQKLGMTRIETDALIVQRSGRGSVRHIFETDGEMHFRELELDVARDLRLTEQAVISTGGGIVMNKLAVDYIGQNGTLIFLDASLETLLSRLGDDASRPLLQEAGQTAALYRLREPLYRHYASIHVVTDHKTPNAVADEIIEALQNASEPSVPEESRESRSPAGALG